jgi:spore coat protein SA
MIYHLLPEWEVFSAYKGGAVARNIANMMRFDVSRIVVCRASDDTWGYGPDRILTIPLLRPYSKIYGRGYFSAKITNLYLRKAFKSLLSLLKAGDIVWCHSQPFFCAALEKSIHAKGAYLIYHAHSSLAPYCVRSKFQLFSPDAVIFVSEFMRQEALQYLPHLKNTYAVHNGANEDLFYPDKQSKKPKPKIPLILYVGRLHPEKGPHVLMDAMTILQKRNIEVQCKVIGSSYSGGSKPTHYVKTLLKNSPSNVHFEGSKSGKEIAAEYRAADVFCCPSIFQEPFGNVNIEAMACGLPVVASRVGGIPEIAADGGILLVDPESSLELANALQKLVQDQQLRTRMAVEGLQSFQKRFTWAKIYKQYQQILGDIRLKGQPKEKI